MSATIYAEGSWPTAWSASVSEDPTSAPGFPAAHRRRRDLDQVGELGDRSIRTARANPATISPVSRNPAAVSADSVGGGTSGGRRFGLRGCGCVQRPRICCLRRRRAGRDMVERRADHHRVDTATLDGEMADGAATQTALPCARRAAYSENDSTCSHQRRPQKLVASVRPRNSTAALRGGRVQTVVVGSAPSRRRPSVRPTEPRQGQG